MKSRHLADEIVSLPQTVEIAQGVDHRRTIERFIDGTPTFSSRLFAVSGLWQFAEKVFRGVYEQH